MNYKRDTDKYYRRRLEFRYRFAGKVIYEDITKEEVVKVLAEEGNAE